MGKVEPIFHLFAPAEALEVAINVVQRLLLFEWEVSAEEASVVPGALFWAFFFFGGPEEETIRWQMAGALPI